MLRGICFLVIITLSVPCGALAEMRPVALEVGAPVPSVIRAWGGPIEKIERETARKADWLYPFGRVTFNQGKVETWETVEGPAIPRTRPIILPPGLDPQAGDPVRASEETEQVLREILSELPSAPDSPSPPDMPPPGGAPILNPISPMPMDSSLPGGYPGP